MILTSNNLFFKILLGDDHDDNCKKIEGESNRRIKILFPTILAPNKVTVIDDNGDSSYRLEFFNVYSNNDADIIIKDSLDDKTYQLLTKNIVFLRQNLGHRRQDCQSEYKLFEKVAVDSFLDHPYPFIEVSRLDENDDPTIKWTKDGDKILTIDCGKILKDGRIKLYSSCF
jgi:hypothetical protein